MIATNDPKNGKRKPMMKAIVKCLVSPICIGATARDLSVEASGELYS
jgi:hypothetical protein